MTHADDDWFPLPASDPEVSLESDAALAQWWESRPRHRMLSVRRVGFNEGRPWSFAEGTGDLVHASGGFFSVRGLRVSSGGSALDQPVIDQPEIGILGILVKEFDGVPHFLMQAKFEPGNVNLRQISPTVQATHSNYTGIHGGRPTPYVEYFRAPRGARVLVDALQSEQGEWFWRKHNRNIIVQVDEDVPEHEDYRWFTLRQIQDMLRRDNLVNMDARTVLSCLPVTRDAQPEPEDAFGRALRRSYGEESRHSMTAVLSWFTQEKTVVDYASRVLPLSAAEGWRRTADEITGGDGAGFRIIMVAVEARIREVSSWVQPLLAPARDGLAAFLVREIDGVLHVLVRARAEPGTRDRVEITPTVQYSASADALRRPEPFADALVSPPRDRVRYDALLSEEGGRFYHAQTRYRIVEAGPDLPAEVPSDYLWATASQLMRLVRHGHYLNIEARTLLLCLHSLT